ncbi:transcriptional activator protein-like protein acu-15 [Dothidotthia symphoricarpi CBS 119687]|uniref:Transcriptional activator protein-like protein acu-15 n=1 Tax=Dothidotthia symphoricarpi CBS 119687 TaxID=1392245 RepID=A0A6A6A471_9PLEO|nr:transcriptional activator protein-like protein acu-15 [Dothidotthia symphoricarpi CBS 119687]KAF2126802.1 transcriptional activator protein-like protein acu-15 [Dothidotthia symphoricarpi CBS 119687]
MPGILPMKVIKIGSSSQARIAQACDRCRSKKIRCDGIRPSCTQCTNVGFECKTSDKLSRRAFPRGYTESLEERTRLLEAEVRELKELLDEKDEKIDMLSRIHSHSSVAHTTGRRPSHQPGSWEVRDKSPEKDDTFKVQAPLLSDSANHDSYFEGGSSGRALIEAFNQKAQKTGRLCTGISSNAFFGAEEKTATSASPKRIVSFKAPPRLVSDQMINIFFQEWAPLFPILHRPTFLSLYEKYVANPDDMVDRKSLVVLNLVFGIATLSRDPHDGQDASSYEAQWQGAIESFLMDNDIETLQCLVLAQIFCLLKADNSRLLQYKGLAIGLSQRLGLHQSQKRFEYGALTSETRKKVFWSFYTVDCLSAAQLGLPMLIKDDDVHCEYPVDADDEYVTEKGFLPTLPGESTKLSSALALFRVTRILSKVLVELYPTSASHEISFQTIASLADDLDDWERNLAPHLKLTFAQDKPSTNVTSSRSPILSLTYHHIRSLIYRPAVIADLGDKSSSAAVAVGDSCKHIVQIVQLLDERGLCFSFCLSRNEVLVQAGFGLLYQTLDLARDGKLIKDYNRLLCSVIEMLERGNARGSVEFRRIGCAMITVPRVNPLPAPSLLRHNSDGNMGAPMDTFRATQKSLKAIAARMSPGSTKCAQALTASRRATLPVIPPSMSMHANPSSTSLSSIHSETSVSRSEPTHSPLANRDVLPMPSKHRQDQSTSSNRNIDYLSFSTNTLPNYGSTAGIKKDNSSVDWERFLSSIDNGQANIYDTIYGGPPADAFLSIAQHPAIADANSTLSPDDWNWENYSEQAPPPQSVLSFSDESLTSGEDFGSNPCDFDLPPGVDKTYLPDYINSLIGTGGLDVNFGL